MNPRVVELEREVTDWMEQLYTAEFATAAFFVGLLTAYGGLLLPPSTQRLGGRLGQPHLLRFFLGPDPAGITYWCAPGRRTILLTVWRVARVPAKFEAHRARQALRGCTAHAAGGHGHALWRDLERRRMSEPGAAEVLHGTGRAYEFGRTVRMRRGRRRLSTAQLAATARTTEEVVDRCEAGGLAPAAPAAERIMGALRYEPPARPVPAAPAP